MAALCTNFDLCARARVVQVPRCTVKNARGIYSSIGDVHNMRRERFFFVGERESAEGATARKLDYFLLGENFFFPSYIASEIFYTLVCRIFVAEANIGLCLWSVYDRVFRLY